MRAQDFPGWLAAIAGLSAEQRGEAVLALAKAGESAAAPEDRQMRCTELMLTPTVSANAALVQWVASCGGSSMVSATTRSATEGSSFGTREGRVLSRKSPSTPSAANRSCQRQTQVLDLPVSRMIAFVPTPSPLSNTICARQACF